MRLVDLLNPTSWFSAAERFQHRNTVVELLLPDYCKFLRRKYKNSSLQMKTGRKALEGFLSSILRCSRPMMRWNYNAPTGHSVPVWS